jgi:hypothetical protein
VPRNLRATLLGEIAKALNTGAVASRLGKLLNRLLAVL